MAEPAGRGISRNAADPRSRIEHASVTPARSTLSGERPGAVALRGCGARSSAHPRPSRSCSQRAPLLPPCCARAGPATPGIFEDHAPWQPRAASWRAEPVRRRRTLAGTSRQRRRCIWLESASPQLVRRAAHPQTRYRSCRCPAAVPIDWLHVLKSRSSPALQTSGALDCPGPGPPSARAGHTGCDQQHRTSEAPAPALVLRRRRLPTACVLQAEQVLFQRKLE